MSNGVKFSWKAHDYGHGYYNIDESKKTSALATPIFTIPAPELGQTTRNSFENIFTNLLHLSMMALIVFSLLNILKTVKGCWDYRDDLQSCEA